MRTTTIGSALSAMLLAGSLGAGTAAGQSATGNGYKELWPMALYDESATAYNPREACIDRGNVAQLELKWRFDETVAGHEVGPIHATPVVDDHAVYVGSNLGRFYAIGHDGQLLWEYLPRQPNPLLGGLVIPSPIGSEIEAVATPVVGAAVLPKHGNLVVFGDMGGNLYGLDRTTGAEVWVNEGVNPHPLGGVVGNSLLLVKDTLYVGFSSIENVAPLLTPFGYQCCSHQGFVAAFDVNTGAQLWSTALVEPAGPIPAGASPNGAAFGPSGADVWGQPTYDVESNTLYVGTGQNFSSNSDGLGTQYTDSVIALDASTGAIKWSYQATADDIWTGDIPNPSNGRYLDQDFGDSPKIYRIPGIGKVVGIGQKSGDFHLLDAATGELILKTTHIGMANSLGGFQNLGAAAYGTVFQHGLARLGPVGQQAFNGVVMALSADGSEELWRYEEFLAPLAGGLAVANHVVYLVSPGAFEVPGLPLPNTASLVALDAHTGEVLLRLGLPGRAVASPVVAGGRVYAGDGNTAVQELGVDESGGLSAFGLPGALPKRCKY